MAAAGKAFTTFEAFFAATFTSLPNIILLPAGRAGLCFSFSITTWGITNFPLAISLAAIPWSAVNTAFTSLGFCPAFDEMAANNPPADIDVVFAFIAFIAFIAFMAFMAFIALAIVYRAEGKERGLASRRRKLVGKYPVLEPKGRYLLYVL